MSSLKTYDREDCSAGFEPGMSGRIALGEEIKCVVKMTTQLKPHKPPRKLASRSVSPRRLFGEVPARESRL
jgi:hypothetical protein